MSAALTVFTYTEHEIRTLVLDGEVWFVLRDCCAVLDISNSRQAATRLSADGVSSADVIDSMGRTQSATIIGEAALYELIFQSRKSEALAFQRWVTRDVLPAIRKTGSYGSPVGMSFEEMTAHVIGELNARIEAAQAKAKELEAPAAAWNGLSRAEGDFTVSDAAKILGRDGIATGPRKLYDWLEVKGWIFRRGGRWQAMQTAINAGLLTERITSGYFDQVTGERKQADPQIRVTPKGLERLRQLLTAERGLVVIDGDLA